MPYDAGTVAAASRHRLFPFSPIMLEDPERPAKRPRSDLDTSSNDDADSLEDLARDNDFWLVDGTVVLIARKVAFKVYMGLLAEQSPVFSDVFSSASSNSSKTLDHAPVVHLSDSPEDLRHLLRALLPNRQRWFVYFSLFSEPFCSQSRNTSLFATRKASPLQFNQLSALVRLAHKYQIDDLQAQAVSALETYFVPDLASLATRSPAFKAPEGCGIEMIYLARLLDMPNLLPFAFYCATFVGGRVANGWSLEDGTVRHLEPDDLRRYIDGYGKLRARAESMLARIFDIIPQAGECVDLEDCGDALEKIYARDIKPLKDDPYLLRSWKVVKPREKYGLCRACVGMLETRFRAERAALWNELPSIFDLAVEGWNAST